MNFEFPTSIDFADNISTPEELEQEAERIVDKVIDDMTSNAVNITAKAVKDMKKMGFSENVKIKRDYKSQLNREEIKQQIIETITEYLK